MRSNVIVLLDIFGLYSGLVCSAIQRPNAAVNGYDEARNGKSLSFTICFKIDLTRGVFLFALRMDSLRFRLVYIHFNLGKKN